MLRNFIVLALLFSVSQGIASARDCVAPALPSVLHQVEASRNIFTARVEDRKYTVVRGQSVTPGRSELRVLRVFKGSLKPGDTIYLTGGDGECSPVFAAGWDMLFYLGNVSAGGETEAPPPANRSGQVEMRNVDLAYVTSLADNDGRAHFYGSIDYGPFTPGSIYDISVSTGKQHYLFPHDQGWFEQYGLKPGKYTFDLMIINGIRASLYREEKGKLVLIESKITANGSPPHTLFQVNLPPGLTRLKLVLSKPAKTGK
jgi:hypothetical protein